MHHTPQFDLNEGHNAVLVPASLERRVLSISGSAVIGGALHVGHVNRMSAPDRTHDLYCWYVTSAQHDSMPH